MDEPQDIPFRKEYLLEGIVYEKFADPVYLHFGLQHYQRQNNTIFKRIFENSVNYYYLIFADLNKDYQLSEQEYLLWQTIFKTKQEVDQTLSTEPLKSLVACFENEKLPTRERDFYYNLFNHLSVRFGYSEFFPLKEESISFWPDFNFSFLAKFLLKRQLNSLDTQIIACRKEVFASEFGVDNVSALRNLYSSRVQVKKQLLKYTLPEKELIVGHSILADISVLNILRPTDESAACGLIVELNKYYSFTKEPVAFYNEFLASYKTVNQIKKSERQLDRYFKYKYPSLTIALVSAGQSQKSFVQTEQFFKALLTKEKLQLADLPLALEQFFIGRFSYAAENEFSSSIVEPTQFFKLNRGVCSAWALAFYTLLNKLNYPCEFFIASRQQETGHAFALFKMHDRYYIFEEHGLHDTNYLSREEALRYFKRTSALQNIYSYSSTRPAGETVTKLTYESKRPLYFERLTVFDQSDQDDALVSKVRGLFN